MDRALKSASGCPVLSWFGRRNKGPGLFRLRAAVCLVALALSLFGLHAFAAPAHNGQVTFGGLPVPGVTVIATQGDKRVVAITDQQGAYIFNDLDDGVWSFQVEMQGFETQTKEIMIDANAPSEMWELKLLPIDQIQRRNSHLA